MISELPRGSQLKNVDTIVTGAGVVSLAVARSLAMSGREVLILEGEATFGTQTSARNSEVIHDGLYYPMPDHAGLGIHVTLDLGGQCKFGPDVSSWPIFPDYSFEAGLEKFFKAIRCYYPDLPDGTLQPGYTGIRPKVTGPTQPEGDFIIQGPDAHGVSGLVTLFGIEPPGLTSCLAIAEKVVEELSHHRSNHVLPTTVREA